MSPPDRAPSLAPVGSVVVLGSVMAVLDVTITNVALDPMSKDLHAPLGSVQWVSTAYALALATVMPASAWAIDRIGARHVYLTCLTVFGVGSGLAAVAPSLPALIACRVLEGLGGGMLMPTGMTIIFTAAGRDRLGLASRILGIPLIVGPALGPAGGVLVDMISWRALFAVNLPVGLVALCLGVRYLPPPRASGIPRRLDHLGLALLSPGLALLIFGLTRSDGAGVAGVGTLLPVIAGLALAAAFVVRSLARDGPLLDLRLLRRPRIAAAFGVSCVFASGYFGSMFLAPLYFQLARGRSVAVSGLLVMPLGVCSAAMLQLNGRLLDRVEPARIVLVGVPVATLGLAGFTLALGPHTPFWILALALAVMGAGVGSTLMPAIAAANRTLAPEEVPSGNTLVQVGSQLSAAIGTALSAVVLSGTLASHLPNAGSGNGLGAAQQLSPVQLRGQLPAIVDAFQTTYLVGIALLAAATVPALLLARNARCARAPRGTSVRVP